MALSANGSLKREPSSASQSVSVYSFSLSRGISHAFIAGPCANAAFYVSAYALDGNIMGITTFATVSVCIVLNIVECRDGGRTVQRAIYQKLAEKQVPFPAANVIASLLFGLWHNALPIRKLCGWSNVGAVH